MDKLVEHARRELDLLGVEPRVAAGLAATVAAFWSLQPTDREFPTLVKLLTDLLAGLPLTPLTANPDEWVVAGQPGVWVNRREPSAVSTDGGRTYRGPDGKVRPAVAPRGWGLARRERYGGSEPEAGAAVWEYLDAGGMSDADREMLSALPPGAVRWDFLMSRWGSGGGAMAAVMFGDDVSPGVAGSGGVAVAAAPGVGFLAA